MIKRKSTHRLKKNSRRLNNLRTKELKGLKSLSDTKLKIWKSSNLPYSRYVIVNILKLNLTLLRNAPHLTLWLNLAPIQNCENQVFQRLVLARHAETFLELLQPHSGNFQASRLHSGLHNRKLTSRNNEATGSFARFQIYPGTDKQV